MLFDIHSDLFMDVDNRRAGGSRSVISENHSERLKEGGVTGMFAPVSYTHLDVYKRQASNRYRS